MECRPHCGACCIAPSISSLNKAAGARCQHLNDDQRCIIFNDPKRPQACADFMPEEVFCGDNQEEALKILTQLEKETG